jgi:hypothetical protein
LFHKTNLQSTQMREIQLSLGQLPDVTLIHVKGHQDLHTANRRLPLLAQRNVDADDKAGEYQRSYGKAHLFVLMSPNAGAFVTTPDRTITAKLLPKLRNHAINPPLWHCIQERYHWTHQTMGAINWKAHGKALSTMISRPIHLTKLVHEGLPTFQQLNKYKGSGPEWKCPACQTAKESRDHIIRCPHGERRRWRTRFMERMDDFHEKEHTSPALRIVWQEAMQSWFADDTSDTQLSPALFPEEVRQVISHQNAIGWRQTFNGRFANAWSDTQDGYLATRPTPANTNKQHRQRNGLRWQHRFILEIWKHWMVVWKLRNERVHGNNKKLSWRHAAVARKRN